MAMYKSPFPTKNPLFEFYISIWKLNIGTMVMRPSYDQLTYEYVRLQVDWANKRIFHIRLFDTYHRLTSRLDGMLRESLPVTLLNLYKIREYADEEIKKIKKNDKKARIFGVEAKNDLTKSTLRPVKN